MKNQIRKFKKLFVRPKKMNTTAVRSAAAASYDDGGDDDTRLSSAFIIVLILHVVAVVGIVAFTRLSKKNNTAAAGATTTNTAPAKGGLKTGTTAAAATVPAAAKATAQLAPETPGLETTTSLTDSSRIQPSTGAIVHTVKPGETLTRVAAIYNTTVAALKQANNLKEDDLAIGKVLTIPAATDLPPLPVTTERVPEAKPLIVAQKPVVTKPAPAKPTVAAAGTHVVKKGENPLQIARIHGVSYDAFVKLNKITDPRKVQVGQVLKLPKK